ncbi:DUF1648 domain-containing protein [bacterium]|nr:MAG: DUF1648 domain-containing protein [bacterium]
MRNAARAEARTIEWETPRPSSRASPLGSWCVRPIVNASRSSLEPKILLGLTLAQIALALVYLPRLPAQVATHFGPSGAADAWSPRGGLVIGVVVVAAIMHAVFLLSARLTRWTNDDLVNLPHKAYWLAPDRRETTMRRIERHVIRMGIATQTLLFLVEQRVLAANVAGTGLGSTVWIYTTVYLTILTLGIVAMVREFATVPTA